MGGWFAARPARSVGIPGHWLGAKAVKKKSKKKMPNPKPKGKGKPKPNPFAKGY